MSECKKQCYADTLMGLSLDNEKFKQELSALRAENERLKEENEAFRHWHIRWLHETDPDCRTLEEQEPMHKEHLRFMLENYQTHKRAKALKGGK
jgi:hypothetical protein